MKLLCSEIFALQIWANLISLSAIAENFTKTNGRYFTFGKAEYFTVRKAKDFTKGMGESMDGGARSVRIVKRHSFYAP